MFIGEPTAKAWQYLINNPEDRKSQVQSAFKALGGVAVATARKGERPLRSPFQCPERPLSRTFNQQLA